MLVVPVPEPDSGAPLQGVSGVEGPAEDRVGGGVEQDWEGEAPEEDPGPPGGREVRASGTELPLHNGCGKADAGQGRGSERDAGGGAVGVGGGAGGRGARRWGGSTTVLAHA